MNTNDDPTESIRRAEQAQLNAAAGERETLEHRHGKVWTTAELSQDFEILQFSAPYAVVKRRADGVMGSVQFQHSPRFYFCFEAKDV